jgi:hypothetical protein
MKKYNILTIQEIETATSNAVYYDTNTFATVQYKNLSGDEVTILKAALIKTKEIYATEGRKDADFRVPKWIPGYLMYGFSLVGLQCVGK